MLNPASRFEENAEEHFSLLRPFAIFFVVALALAVTSSQPVVAGSREHPTRHTASGKLQPQAVRSTRSHATASRRSSARSVKSTAAIRPVRSRGRRRVMTSAHRVVAVNHPVAVPMAQPVAGVNAIVEAAPAEHIATAPANAAAVAATSVSASEMAQAAVAPHVFPMYTRAGRLIVPPPLRGSHEILVHQNQMADAAGLERIENDEELDRLRYSHQLVDLAETSALRINPELPENRRSARPWTAKFASDIARAYYARFGQPLELNSAVRTITYQLRLQRVNGNAADIAGETASPHLTGQAIDFGKKGMTKAQIAWMRLYLTPLMNAGIIDVEEEFQQACFHISVYRSYAPTRSADVAQTHRAPDSITTAQAIER